MSTPANRINEGPGPAIITGSDPRRPSRYEAPFRYDGSGPSQDRILGWMREAVNEGEWFLRNQSGHQFIDASWRIMNDIGFDELPSTLSHVSDNIIKRDVRELVATLSNPRPISSYKCDNSDYDSQAWLLNQLYLSWYQNCFVDRSIRSALQYAAVEGTGYLLTDWDPGYWTMGRGDVRLRPLGVDSVLPLQMNSETWDLQTSYVTIIRVQYPITEVIRMFPHMVDKLVPDGEPVGRLRKLLSNMVEKVAATVHNTYGSQRGYRQGEDPGSRFYVTLYHIYIQDRQLNTSGTTAQMGVAGSPWEYQVPSLGTDIPTGVFDAQGRPLTRKADAHDSRMFPFRRHIVATRTQILYDDTSRWWHGQVPLVKFTLDDWPSEYCGIPITKEPAKLQAMITSLLRAYDDSANARLRPPVTYDGNRTSEAEARKFDPRKGGQIIEASDTLGPVFKMAMDPAYYNMQSDILTLIEWGKNEASRLIGNQDLTALTEAAQIPSGDTIEKLEQLAGPLSTDMSRNMEASVRQLGEQFKGYAFEFYTAKRRFQVLGPDGLTAQDFDYDPGELTPGNLPGASRSERARRHMANFYFHIVPNSMYRTTQASRSLLMLQLARMGQPISPYTLMELFDVPNPGRPAKLPDGREPLTEIDRWKAWKLEEAQVMIEVQMQLAQAQMAMQQQMDPLGQLSSAIQQAVQSPTAGGGNPQGQGRPPTAQKMPHVESKDGGTRSTISES